MSISDTTLDTDVWNTIRGLLTSTTIYITNTKTSTTTAVSVNASYDDKDEARPQIVVYPVEESSNKFKFGSKSTKFINVLIDCYATHTINLDQMSDQVINRLEDNPISEISLVGLSVNNVFDTVNNSKVFGKTITLTYDKS